MRFTLVISLYIEDEYSGGILNKYGRIAGRKEGGGIMDEFFDFLYEVHTNSRTTGPPFLFGSGERRIAELNWM